MAVYTQIDDPSAFFKCQLYSGNGGTQSITFNDTDTNMQPDLVWLKNRSITIDHVLVDAVRGASKILNSNDDSADDTVSGGVTAFDSDGFSVGSESVTNNSSENYVAWCWKAGTTSGITTNAATDITPSAYSFNATSKFSIVKYAGATTAGQLAHGLGATPTFHIIKKTSGTGNWQVYSKAVGNTATLALNQNYTTDANAYYYNNTDPDSVNITLGSGSSNTSVNTSGQTYICYSFADVQGFSKFGSYEGNSNADGTYVHLGFRPAIVLVKNADYASDWWISTAKINGYNVQDDFLVPNTTEAENTNHGYEIMDFLSNGFKCRGNGTPINETGDTMIYAAFAEAPFVNSKGVPGNAR